MNLHSIKGLVMWYMHLPFRIKKYQRNNERNVARIRRKDKITVVFFASNVSMWRYQGLWEEMHKYPRYETHIVLTPLKCFSMEELESGFEGLRTYFTAKGMPFHDFDVKANVGCDVKALNPDLMFYVQPYYTICTYKPHRYQNFKNALLGYYPYGFSLRRQKSDYDEDFHNRAWRRYYENEYTREDCKVMSASGDYNVRIVGYPNADIFLKSKKDVWKPQPIRKKRIIWAPHFTINNDGWCQNSNFCWMADLMLELADKYKDRIQIAFKPHPRLLSELYNHPDWGKEKADKFYEEWMKRGNTQLEMSGYVDLFVSSDAMIHDCGSFAGEYMYTGNPVMYVNQDMSVLYKVANTLGTKVYDMHYVGKNDTDLEYFINEIVLNGKDPKKVERQSLRKNYMMPPNGKTVAENTMEDILNSLSQNNI